MRMNMRAERVRNGYTSQQVADILGVSVNSVLGWERGSSEPLGKSLIGLAKLYGCSPEYLLETDGKPNQAVATT